MYIVVLSCQLKTVCVKLRVYMYIVVLPYQWKTLCVRLRRMTLAGFPYTITPSSTS